VISIIYHNPETLETERVEAPGNESYLVTSDPSRPYLSEASSVDEDVFTSADMAPLIRELEDVKCSVSASAAEHVDDIIALAEKCRYCAESVLMFTPFGSYLEQTGRLPPMRGIPD
jgi:hypothetical protein